MVCKRSSIIERKERAEKKQSKTMREEKKSGSVSDMCNIVKKKVKMFNIFLHSFILFLKKAVDWGLVSLFGTAYN